MAKLVKLFNGIAVSASGVKCSLSCLKFNKQQFLNCQPEKNPKYNMTDIRDICLKNHKSEGKWKLK